MSTRYSCYGKYRDKNNKIIGYELMDENGSTGHIGADELKRLIASNQIIVTNLKLTADNRLIDKIDDRNDKAFEKIKNHVKGICNYFGYPFNEEEFVVHMNDGHFNGVYYMSSELKHSEVFGDLAFYIEIKGDNATTYEVNIFDWNKELKAVNTFNVHKEFPVALAKVSLGKIKKVNDYMNQSPKSLYGNKEKFKPFLEWLYKSSSCRPSMSKEAFVGKYVGNLNRALAASR